MYKLEKLIEEGHKAMRENPNRELTVNEIKTIYDNNKNDLYGFGVDIYFAGVAIGKRIGKAELKKHDK